MSFLFALFWMLLPLLALVLMNHKDAKWRLRCASGLIVAPPVFLALSGAVFSACLLSVSSVFVLAFLFSQKDKGWF